MRFNITGKWRALHNDECHSVNYSPNIIKMFKSRIMRLVGHVACRGQEKVIQMFFLEIPKGMYY
jgi:hypothetical protein